MPLDAGTLLGSFEILAPLGAGGMGEVYRARDAKLGREVAIKVLPAQWGQDRDRLARIDREARVLASLNHPNIAALFGYEEHGGIRFLAMELVPGDTLAERLAARGMAVREVLDVARQIAEALEEAHARGVVHRDLKPANVKVTPEGRVKVLDFGLAKVLRNGTEETSHTVTDEGTTREGQIMGTPCYMSPEQARGLPLDTRTDVWSFGCVLYEMLARRRAFGGPSLSDVLAAVLEHEADWAALPAATPAGVRTLLRRCLERERRRRLQSIGDARLELEEELRGASASPAVDAPRPLRPRKPLAVGMAVLSLGAAVGIAAGRLMPRQPPVGDAWAPRRLALPIPKDAEALGFGGIAISPQGDRVAYVAQSKGTSAIYTQELTSFEPHAVRGSEDARAPTFSPDGRRLAFLSKGFFKTVPVDGGDAIPVCAAPAGTRGPVWPQQDFLFFLDPPTGALMRVPASGGTPEEFIRIEGSSILPEPDLLPTGRAILITLSTRSAVDSMAALDLDTRELTRINADPPARYPHYIPTGHLMYDATPRALGPELVPPRWVLARFDPENLRIGGAPRQVLGDLRTGGYVPGWVVPHASGILAYTAVPAPSSFPRALEWVDARGGRTALDIGGREFVPYSVALSPDGQRLALSIRDGATFDLWVCDLQRETWLRLTVDGESQSPLWSPDGTRIVYASGRERRDLYWVPADGAGSPELLAKAETAVLKPTSFSPDGRTLLLAKGTWDGPPRNVGVLMYAIDLQGDRTPRVVIDAPYPVSFGAYSPDGRWVAFVTLESGIAGVYLRSADLTGRRWALSKTAGFGPAWSPTGRELLFHDGEDLVSVPVTAAGPGEAQVVVAKIFTEAGNSERSFEVGNGRYLIWQPPREEGSPREERVVVIPNWLDEVRARTRMAEQK